jgi:hypothetical protein
VAKLCSRGLAASTDPGNFTVLHACAMLDNAAPVAGLLTAGALLEAKLTMGYQSPELQGWVDAANLQQLQVKGCWDVRSTAVSSKIAAGQSALALAAMLGHSVVACALLKGGADLRELLAPPFLTASTAAVTLAPLVAREMVAGRLAVASSQELGYMLRSFVDAQQAAACLDILREAAGQQGGLALATSDAAYLLRQAAHRGLGRDAELAMAVIEAAADIIWACL